MNMDKYGEQWRTMVKICKDVDGDIVVHQLDLKQPVGLLGAVVSNVLPA